MKLLIEEIARALVDDPAGVSVNVVEGQHITIFELRVAKDDIGKVIGREGRMARSIRTILDAAGMKQRRRFALEILE